MKSSISTNQSIRFFVIMALLVVVPFGELLAQGQNSSDTVLLEFFAGVTGGIWSNFPAIRFYFEQGINNTSCPPHDELCKEISYTLGNYRLIQSQQFILPLGTFTGVVAAALMNNNSGNFPLALFGAYVGAISGIGLSITLITVGNSLDQFYRPFIQNRFPENIERNTDDFFGLLSDFTMILMPPILSSAFATIGYHTALQLDGVTQSDVVVVFAFEY